MIKILSIFPKELIDEVSPRCSLLRKTIKVPLITLLAGAGLVQAEFNVLCKAIGEILTGDPQPGDVGLTFRMFVAGMCANLFQLLFINVAMKYYD